jgi:hypothetical protein
VPLRNTQRGGHEIAKAGFAQQQAAEMTLPIFMAQLPVAQEL